MISFKRNKKEHRLAEDTDLADNRKVLRQELNQVAARVNAAADDCAAATERTEELAEEINKLSSTLDIKVDGAEVIDNALYLTSQGAPVAGPFSGFGGGSGGGGGGSSTNNAVLSVSNASGWTTKTVAEGADCVLSVSWSSVENDMPTGAGTAKITNNGLLVATLPIQQGLAEINLKDYLTMGANALRVEISDVYENRKTLIINVKVIAVSLASTFDASMAFDDAITFPYTPTGAVSKIVHFLLDGEEVGTQTVATSGRQQTFFIPAQAHGSHTLEAFFTAIVDGQEVESNHLYYDLICIKVGNYSPIIAVDFNEKTASQYSSIVIPYTVYNPDALTSDITIKVNGEVYNTLTVDRTRQTLTVRAATAGSLTVEIICQEVKKSLTLTITEANIDAKAETEDLALHLSSYGRSNAEANPAVWKFGDIAASFSGFNFLSDGWQKDGDGVSVLRVSGDARLSIPYQLFANDARITGKTIEFEFTTRDVRDYDAAIISCFSGNRGIILTAQEARLKSEQSEIFMQYKDGEHIRVSFVIEKRAKNRLIYVYVDGEMSGVVRYPEGDDFQQTNPVGLSIGSNECAVDLYCIRVYDNDLTKYQIMDNWVADTQNGPVMLDRYAHNNVFDEYGRIVIDKLPKNLPYLIIEAPALPQSKGDKKTCAGRYVDPINPDRSFTFQNASIDVQGTSSQYYARKNYKVKFKNFVTTAGESTKYPLRPGAVPVSTFCFKADVASSEGANNVELVRLYNDANPYKTPPQAANEAVRQGIDGFPIVIFWNDGNTTEFLGKYNFNNDKSTEDVFGFQDGDESWEMLNNTSDRNLFKNADFSGDWSGDFEGRYPDGNTTVENLKNFIAYYKNLKDSGTATKALLEAESMITSALFYWLFTELFLMVDSRAKNSFPTFYQTDGKWCWLPYDFDTALGINNEGQLVFGYSLEDTDHLEGGADVFNGQESNYWTLIRDNFQDEIKAMYKDLRASGALSYQKVRGMFDEHQAKWPVAIFNEDAQFKYLDPLIHDGDAAYLTMLQGSKKSQRDWWLYNRFRYFDSKYNCGDDQTDVITLRGYAKANITVIPYADLYVNVKYGSYLVTQRGQRNTAYEMVCPLDNVNDTEIYIYSASRLASVGDLSGLKVGYANFAAAEKLQELKLGDASSSYSNPNLTELHLGNNKLLKTIDCQNCPKLGTGTMATIDVSGCSNLESLYFQNTSITGVELPNGGLIKEIHLPSTVTSLKIQNQKAINVLDIEPGAQISTLWLDNVTEAINPKSLIAALPDNSRLRWTGFSYEVSSLSEIEALMDIWDKHRGLDENGNTTEQAQISGTFHITYALGSDLATLKARYPYVTINADHITAYLYYMSEDGSSQLYREEISDGGNGTYAGTASKSATAQYKYTFSGWSRTPGGTAWADAKKNVTADRYVYAAFTATVQTYTVYFYCGSTLLYTATNVRYGSNASYGGPATSTLVDPSGNGQPFQGWQPSPNNVTGNTSCYAQFMPPLEDTITDSWDTIIANINSAATGADCGYSLGDTKIVDFGSDCGPVCMQLVAFDMDNLADGSGKAKTTWLAKEIGRTSHRMNPSRGSTTDDDGNTVYTEGTGTIGGWEHCEMRTYVKSLKENLPTALQNAIKNVTKTHQAYNTAGSSFTQTTTDDLWIPCYTEMYGTSGVNYTGFFGTGTQTSKIKYKVGATSAYDWWMRYAISGNGFRCVWADGDWNNGNAHITYGVVPGFCL